jgi:hypothetical protein
MQSAARRPVTPERGRPDGAPAAVARSGCRRAGHGDDADDGAQGEPSESPPCFLRPIFRPFCVHSVVVCCDEEDLLMADPYRRVAVSVRRYSAEVPVDPAVLTRQALTDPSAVPRHRVRFAPGGRRRRPDRGAPRLDLTGVATVGRVVAAAPGAAWTVRIAARGRAVTVQVPVDAQGARPCPHPGDRLAVCVTGRAAGVWLASLTADATVTAALRAVSPVIAAGRVTVAQAVYRPGVGALAVLAGPPGVVDRRAAARLLGVPLHLVAAASTPARLCAQALQPYGLRAWRAAPALQVAWGVLPAAALRRCAALAALLEAATGYHLILRAAPAARRRD